MNIFLAFQQSQQNYPIPAYSFWQFYLKNGIEEAGHHWAECSEVDWAFGLVPKGEAEHANWKAETWEKTVAWLKQNPADLFLSYLYPQQVDVSAIGEIKKMGIPCVNFFCDNIRDFRKAPVEFSVFTLNWVPEFNAQKLYKQAGYNFIHLPMPVWIAPGLRVKSTEIYPQVTFIGSRDIQRQLFFEEVSELNSSLPLAIYGNGWQPEAVPSTAIDEGYTIGKQLMYQLEFLKKNGAVAYYRKLRQRGLPAPLSAGLQSKVHQQLSFHDYNSLTAGSMVTIGINRYPSFDRPLMGPGTYSRLRDLEAPMLGACYATEYTDGIAELYNLDTEIAVFKSPEEFVEKVEHLRADVKKRNLLKINGQKRALQDHSIKSSLSKIIKRLAI